MTVSAQAQEAPGAAAPEALRSGPGPGWRGVGPAVGLWVVSRLVVMAVVVGTARTLNIEPSLRQSNLGGWLVFRFAHWDSLLYGAVALRGYQLTGQQCCYQAFFPGFPGLMAALAPLSGNNVFVAGFVVAQVAGLVSAVLIWRLAADGPGRQAAGRWAVLFLAAAPLSVFFTVVYTESLFLALVLGAWLMGLRRRWWFAGVLSALACAVRINGLFLVAGLGVMYLMQLREARRWQPKKDVMALAAGPAVVAVWMGYLHARTGSWRAWSAAEEKGWGRHPAWPSEGVQVSLHRIQKAWNVHWMLSGWADLLAAVLSVALVVVFLRLRRWPEATFLGLSAISIVCSTLYVSAPRYALTLFPAYLLAARASVDRPWLRRGLIAACVPLMVLTSCAYGARLWIA
jgi:hypothetical protein